MSAPSPVLRKAMTMRYAVALYMSSVLGSGVLVLPGLAAQIAGPASLVAWVALSLISYPLAYTFASLSARKPESGGVYSFARESLGPGAANAVGWLFILWYVTGAPVVTVIAASYLGICVSLESDRNLPDSRASNTRSILGELSRDRRQQPSTAGGHSCYRGTADHRRSLVRSLREPCKFHSLLSQRLRPYRNKRSIDLLVITGI